VPAGDPDHHYHFQVSALSAELPLKAGANHADLLAVMQGRVLAGENWWGPTRERSTDTTPCFHAGAAEQQVAYQ
jgi:phosphatidylethanolamine-binding protein (PEBP) family uncharacterized protein